MRDWRHYWNHAEQVFDDEPLRQVGKTVGGQPIASAILDAIVADIVLRLDLDGSDAMLDLCCGNGLITNQVAQRCREVVGVDVSSPLIDVAARRFGSANIRYLCSDVTGLPAELGGRTFGKFLMYEAVQHLDATDLNEVFSQVAGLSRAGALFYMGSIPDHDRIWRFYDTPERQRDYERSVAEGTDSIGYWWTKEQLATLARRHGFDIEMFDPSASRHGAHYRFDALAVNRRSPAAC